MVFFLSSAASKAAPPVAPAADTDLFILIAEFVDTLHKHTVIRVYKVKKKKVFYFVGSD